MRLHRFYSPNLEGTDELTHQLRNVFKYKTGQQVILFDGSGSDFLAEITHLDKKKTLFSILETRKGLVQKETLGKEVALCFSMIKKDIVEYILQKCTELGVVDFFPVISERSEKKSFNVDRARKIIIEAAEQSGWSVVPHLHEVSTLEEVARLNFDRKIAFDGRDLASKQKEISTEKGKTLFFIGPEGGWTDSEREFFSQNGIEIQTLGAQTLRAETAALVAAVVLLHNL